MNEQTGQNFDDLLKNALLEAAAADFASVLADADEIEVDFSPEYMARRQALLEDPKGYARRAARARRPMWRKFLQAAACLLLITALTFAAVCTVSPDARAWVRQFFIEWLSDRASIHFQGEPQGHGETGDWQPDYLPEGFELVEEHLMSLMSIVTYQNGDGVAINLTYTSNSQLNAMIDTEHQDHYQIEINGNAADFFPANVPDEVSYLIWVDEEHDTYFELMSYLEDSSELIKIAESMRFYPAPEE